MNKQEILNIIKEAGQNLFIISMEYKEKDGTNEGFRNVEPYSLRDLDTEKEAFFAFDIAKNGIRRFSLRNILNIKIINQKFTPRNNWEVEF